MANKRPPPQLSEEQIALSQARKLKKLKLASEQSASASTDADKGRIIERAWIDLKDPRASAAVQRIKILTWNLLAQCLVRRELFPTSNCLKAKDREHMLYREILIQDADILCLQEVDRLESLLPVLEKAGYSHDYAAGPGKKHGCLVAFKTDKYQKMDQVLIQYDEQDIRLDGEAQSRRGCSFRTRNIGTIVALKDTKGENGVLVATTHLFWHPKYNYERTRQAGILKREVVNFRTAGEYGNWPCLISGDFNCAPDDPAYSLLVGDPLLPLQETRLQDSRVVHKTIDPTVPVVTVDAAAEEENGDPDKIITNARSATPADGLLSSPELVALYSCAPPLRSAYDAGLRQYREAKGETATYGDRVTLLPTRHGIHEPEWTSYTHYWKTVLDYIFFLDPPGRRFIVNGLLAPHQTDDLKPGIPQKGVCGSDHISLAAELLLIPDTQDVTAEHQESN